MIFSILNILCINFKYKIFIYIYALCMLRVDKIIKQIKELGNSSVDLYINNTINNRKLFTKNLQNVLEPIEDYLGIYIEEFQKNIIPKHTKYKYIVCIIHILHIIGVFIFILFGFFMPPRLQIYIAIFYIIIMFSWNLFGKCILVSLTNYIGGTQDDFLFPFRWSTMYSSCIILIFISLLFYNLPIISPFNLLRLLDIYSGKTIDYLQEC